MGHNLPGSRSVALANKMHPTHKLAAPVDWSEFHVWNFRIQDAEKLKRRRGNVSETEDTGINTNATVPIDTTDLKEGKNSGMKSQTVATSLLTAPNSAGHQLHTSIQRQRKAWNIFHHQPNKGSPTHHVHKGHVYTAYAQFASGAIGGCTATYATHWLDTIKVKMQTLPQVYTSRGPISCLRDTVSQEGLRGLYKGAAPAVIGQTAKTAVVFMSYGICEELVCYASGHSHVSDLTVWHHASAGAMTGIAASFVLCPLELVKCRLQALHQVSLHVESKKLPKKSAFKRISRSAPFTMVRDILHHDGVRGLYRGLPGIWVKDVPGSFIYFGSYEAARALVRHSSGNQHMHLNSRTVFLCGMLAGLCFCITHPIESVKTRVQVMSAVSETRGFMGAMVDILKTEGVRPLCCGLKACVIRACLYSGIQFVTYEACKDALLPDHF